ncbi:hypothetical protein N9324_00120 [Candidatus Pelagibacter sp.]|nr:hypothetical protein [Candidatus Pelagibacter sp.]
MNETSYKNLLLKFLKAGYSFKNFNNFQKNKTSQVILRHDVDFDMNFALKMSLIEKKLGIKSTYYFLLSSDSYNIFSPRNKIIIEEISRMSHEVSLHFDPTVYKNESEGFKFEKNLFESKFCKIKSISFHRPSKDILKGVKWLPKDIINAYDNNFFKQIFYVSDSGGSFKYGHPIKSDTFMKKENMQLLTHPIWWMCNKRDTISKIKELIILNKKKMSEHISQNCKPWKEFIND